MSASDSAGLVPGYVLGDVIGKGGFATVYRARQISLNRDVAVKIDSRVLDDQRNQRRFLREATASALISSHPHVVSLIDAGTTRDNRPYLVMELCDNGSVAQLVRRGGPMPAADVLELGIAISSALAAAHQRGILHRDIKPANILIDPYGTPRLGDFGLAAMSAPGHETSVTLEALTPAYAAPEAFEQAIPTKRADVWALGATLYAILTGVTPRHTQDGSPQTVAEMIQNLDKPLPAMAHITGADPLMTVIWRATEPEKERRFADGTQVHDALLGLRGKLGSAQTVLPSGEVTRMAGPQQQQHFPTTTPPNVSSRPSPQSRPTPRPQQSPQAMPGKAAAPRRAWPAIVAGVTVIALGGVALAAAMLNRPDPEQNTSEPTPSSSASATPTSPSMSSSQSPLLVFDIASEAQCYKKEATHALKPLDEYVIECAEEHYWEAFAWGILDSSTTSLSKADVAKDPAVEQACTMETLGKYGDAGVNVAIEPRVPTQQQFAEGKRTFFCLVGGVPSTGSVKG